MTKEMREFLTAWLAWAQGGGVESHEFGSVFSRSTGLCAASNHWAESTGAQFGLLIGELGDMLECDGLCSDFPFDTEDSYFDAAAAQEQHLNPARLAWVRSKLEVSDE